MYRLAVELTKPFTLLFLVVLVSAISLWFVQRRRRLCLSVLTVCLMLLAVICFPPMSHLAVWSIERHYRPLDSLPRGVDTMVVLAGGIRLLDRSGERAEAYPATAFRCLEAARLYRRAGGGLIIVTGGKLPADRPGPAEAALMRDLLVNVGVRPEDVLVEEKSRTTYENAIYASQMLRERHIGKVALVTDATHMPRALASFRAAGIAIVPAPCNYYAEPLRVQPGTFLPSAGAADRFQTAWHEWLGIVWYRLHGRL